MDDLALPEPLFIDSRSILLVGIRQPLDTNAATDIPLLWQTFSSIMGTITYQMGHNSFGVCLPDDSDQRHFYYMAAVEVSRLAALPASLSSIELPAQRYAVFVHRAHVSRIKTTIDTIFDQWLPQAQVSHANQILHFFERYTASYNPHTGTGGIEIWLPIKP